MGGGAWTRDSYNSYSATRGRSVDSRTGELKGSYTAQELFTQRRIASELNPYKVIRECCDSDEHPETSPVILGLDVTGSMGASAVEVAKKLNVIMTELYGKVKDIEFLVMGIGDLAYDEAPIQASQFESDIRIAEQLDKLYFEGGGGGNNFESYTAAWYMGARHTKLDCWKRGRKGIIITMGDELLNPYLPKNGRYSGLTKTTGDDLQGDIETKDLYEEVYKKYNVYHLVVDHGYSSNMRAEDNRKSFAEVIGEQNVKVVTLENISDAIVEIILGNVESTEPINETQENGVGTISW